MFDIYLQFFFKLLCLFVKRRFFVLISIEYIVATVKVIRNDNCRICVPNRSPIFFFTYCVTPQSGWGYLFYVSITQISLLGVESFIKSKLNSGV